MSDTPWTKGPWFVEPVSFRVLASDDRQTIIHVPPGSPTNVECQVESHLISAAPDMAEALDALLARQIEWLKEAGCDEQEIADDPLVIAARAALAKARGQT